LSVKTEAKRQRRAKRRSVGARFGQAPRIEVVADDATLTPFGGRRSSVSWSVGWS